MWVVALIGGLRSAGLIGNRQKIPVEELGQYELSIFNTLVEI